MINVYSQPQLKETSKLITDLFERIKVYWSFAEAPSGAGEEKERWIFFPLRAPKTLSQLSLITLAASFCHQRDQQGGLSLTELIGQRTGMLYDAIAKNHHLIRSVIEEKP